MKVEFANCQQNLEPPNDHPNLFTLVMNSYISSILNIWACVNAFVRSPARTIERWMYAILFCIFDCINAVYQYCARKLTSWKEYLDSWKEYFGRRLAVLAKTPEEYAEEAFRRTYGYRYNKDFPPKGLHKLPYSSLPRPGKIRVKWFHDIKQTLPGPFDPPDLWADVALEKNGELDLRVIKRMWGLENVYPIDWPRLRVFEPTNPDRLSAVAVTLLMEGQPFLRIIEKPSLDRQDIRQRRARLFKTLKYYRGAPRRYVKARLARCCTSAGRLVWWLRYLWKTRINPGRIWRCTYHSLKQAREEAACEAYFWIGLVVSIIGWALICVAAFYALRYVVVPCAIFAVRNIAWELAKIASALVLRAGATMGRKMTEKFVS